MHPCKLPLPLQSSSVPPLFQVPLLWRPIAAGKHFSSRFFASLSEWYSSNKRDRNVRELPWCFLSKNLRGYLKSFNELHLLPVIHNRLNHSAYLIRTFYLFWLLQSSMQWKKPDLRCFQHLQLVLICIFHMRSRCSSLTSTPYISRKSFKRYSWGTMASVLFLCAQASQSDGLSWKAVQYVRCVK